MMPTRERRSVRGECSRRHSFRSGALITCSFVSLSDIACVVGVRGRQWQGVTPGPIVRLLYTPIIMIIDAVPFGRYLLLSLAPSTRTPLPPSLGATHVRVQNCAWGYTKKNLNGGLRSVANAICHMYMGNSMMGGCRVLLYRSLPALPVARQVPTMCLPSIRAVLYFYLFIYLFFKFVVTDAHNACGVLPSFVTTSIVV